MRRFEGFKFAIARNNGVAAIADEATIANRRKLIAIIERLKRMVPGQEEDNETRINVDAGLRHLRTPIFTFPDGELSEMEPWYTGDYRDFQLLCQYIEEQSGHLNEHTPLYVPFSNGVEYGSHGSEPQHYELRYVTTEQQFYQTFGVTLEELRAV